MGAALVCRPSGPDGGGTPPTPHCGPWARHWSGVLVKSVVFCNGEKTPTQIAAPRLHYVLEIKLSEGMHSSPIRPATPAEVPRAASPLARAVRLVRRFLPGGSSREESKSPTVLEATEGHISPEAMEVATLTGVKAERPKKGGEPSWRRDGLRPGSRLSRLEGADSAASSGSQRESASPTEAFNPESKAEEMGGVRPVAAGLFSSESNGVFAFGLDDDLPKSPVLVEFGAGGGSDGTLLRPLASLLHGGAGVTAWDDARPVIANRVSLESNGGVKPDGTLLDGLEHGFSNDGDGGSDGTLLKLKADSLPGMARVEQGFGSAFSLSINSDELALAQSQEGDTEATAADAAAAEDFGGPKNGFLNDGDGGSDRTLLRPQASPLRRMSQEGGAAAATADATAAVVTACPLKLLGKPCRFGAPKGDVQAWEPHLREAHPACNNSTMVKLGLVKCNVEKCGTILAVDEVEEHSKQKHPPRPSRRVSEASKAREPKALVCTALVTEYDDRGKGTGHKIECAYAASSKADMVDHLNESHSRVKPVFCRTLELDRCCDFGCGEVFDPQTSKGHAVNSSEVCKAVRPGSQVTTATAAAPTAVRKGAGAPVIAQTKPILPAPSWRTGQAPTQPLAPKAGANFAPAPTGPPIAKKAAMPAATPTAPKPAVEPVPRVTGPAPPAMGPAPPATGLGRTAPLPFVCKASVQSGVGRQSRLCGQAFGKHEELLQHVTAFHPAARSSVEDMGMVKCKRRECVDKGDNTYITKSVAWQEHCEMHATMDAANRPNQEHAVFEGDLQVNDLLRLLRSRPNRLEEGAFQKRDEPLAIFYRRLAQTLSWLPEEHIQAGAALASYYLPSAERLTNDLRVRESSVAAVGRLFEVHNAALEWLASGEDYNAAIHWVNVTSILVHAGSRFIFSNSKSEDTATRASLLYGGIGSFAREVAKHSKGIFVTHCEPVVDAPSGGFEVDVDLEDIGDEKKAKKVDILVRKDAPSKAYRVATDTSTSKPFDQQAVNECQNMFHSNEPESVLDPPTHPQRAAYSAAFAEACTVENVVGFIKGLSAAAATGAGGFSVEVLNAIAVSKSPAKVALAQYIKFWGTGVVPEGIRRFLAGGQLACIPKSSGGRRFIAPQGVIAKLVGQLVLHIIFGKQVLVELVGENQYCMMSSGLPLAAESVEHALMSNGDTVCASLDVAACFPSLSRNKVHDNLMASGDPRLLKLAVYLHQEYAAAPIFQVRTTFGPTEIPMNNGLAQGFVSSCLLLALYTKPKLD